MESFTPSRLGISNHSILSSYAERDVVGERERSYDSIFIWVIAGIRTLALQAIDQRQDYVAYHWAIGAPHKINLFLSLLLWRKKSRGQINFFALFSSNRRWPSPERISSCWIFFYISLAYKEKEMDMINVFVCPFFQGEKNPGDKLMSLPFFQVTVDDLRPRESLNVEKTKVPLAVKAWTL